MAGIKKGDQVKVLAGADKGVTGKVIEVLTDADRVIVEGVNRVKKHTRAAQTGGAETGGIITVEAPIHISNVALVVDGDDGKTTTRIGYRRDDVTKTRPDGSTYAAQRSVRISRKTGKEI
ncbi:50S ribosomal protein L24 [Aeromicrobium alkaliterrae]|uniref:Large ribosomal subunit protein uL24 n=1 Tax=Aeromicrobium alkaliterrae TaxID=302168 RepID=A0ABN2KCY9_9ACTN